MTSTQRVLAPELQQQLEGAKWDVKERLTLACRMLAADGHSTSLAGQVTARLEDDTFWTAPLGLLFDEVRPGDLVRIDDSLDVVEGARRPNPATQFHMWVYRQRPDVKCIIHTHPPNVSALSMIGEPLVVSHMDATPLFDDCGFLADWPGLPLADHEGRLIADALGGRRAVLLAHHGLLTAGSSIEEAATLAIFMENAARLQLLARAAGEVRSIPTGLAQEAHDFLLQPSIVNATFAAFARRVMRKDATCFG